MKTIQDPERLKAKAWKTFDTAAKLYADRQKDIGALLELVGEELRVHAQVAAKKPRDWGYAGDLGRVRESLKNILQFFLISRYEWSETEASRFIEGYLDDGAH